MPTRRDFLKRSGAALAALDPALGSALGRGTAESSDRFRLWAFSDAHVGSDLRYGHRESLVETKWGVHFVNVSALARHHARRTTVPMSRHFIFHGNEARVGCYLHSCDHAAPGWYRRAERRLRLRKEFRWSP